MEENLISVIMTTYNESAKELTEAVIPFWIKPIPNLN